MPATPAQIDAQLDCMCPGDVPDNIFRWGMLAYLSALLSGGGTPTPFTLPTASATLVQTTVPIHDSNTAILASNPTRKGGWVKNVSDVDIYVSLSAAATLGAPTLLSPGQSLNFGVMGLVLYTGAVAGIHGAAGLSKNVEVVEF